jgi:hypothetical protein
MEKIQPRLTPLQAIKKHCLEDCCCGDHKEWKNCLISSCVLYRYRFGHQPDHKGKGNINNLKSSPKS